MRLWFWLWLGQVMSLDLMFNEADKPYSGETPDDKPEDFRRGNQGDKININDGSIWSPERAGDRAHGGSKWKRWPNARDKRRNKNRESVRPDGSVR